MLYLVLLILVVLLFIGFPMMVGLASTSFFLLWNKLPFLNPVFFVQQIIGSVEPYVLLCIPRSDRRQADAIVVPDTVLPTLSLIETVESRIGKPLLTANQVTLWEGMRLAGCLDRLTGWGCLFGDRSYSQGGM